MGEAAPPQPAAAGFAPVFAVGIPGPVAGGHARGPAVPQLHSAIVERLRARIELCRRHHSSCESRYRRGQAESWEREHESTLHLLSLAHQGAGGRRARGSRAAAAQQHAAEHSGGRANGEPHRPQGDAERDSKSSTRIALQGSLRRKIEGQPPEYNSKEARSSEEVLNSVFKRIRTDGDTLLHGGCVFSNGQSQAPAGNSPTSHNVQTKDNDTIGQAIGSDLLSLALKEVKKEPGDIPSCGKSFASTSNTFNFKDEGASQIDPELQDLFDELTKSVTPLNEHDFEKILKQEDGFSMEMGRLGSKGGREQCSHIDKVIKTEYSPGFQQDDGGSAQLGTACVGSAFMSSGTVAMVPKNSHQGSQGPLAVPGGLNSWLEVSHAEQLKQMAANQQPSMLLQSQQPSQPRVVASWSSAVAPSSAPGLYSLKKMLGPTSVCQPGISPLYRGLPPLDVSQKKGVSDCLVQLGGHCGSSLEDASGPLSQAPLLENPHGKQQGHSMQIQNQQAPARFQTPHLPILPSPCQPNKSLLLKTNVTQHGPGLHIKLSQQRQEKLGAQDRSNCQLTRPPPEYNQSRQSMSDVLQPNIYTGGFPSSVSSSQPLSNTVSSQSSFYANTSHFLSSQDAKVTPSPGERFTMGPNHQSVRFTQVDVDQLEQSSNKNHLEPMRPATTQRLENMLTNTSVTAPTNWAQDSRQVPIPQMLSTTRFSDSPRPHHSGQTDMESHQFPQRPIHPPSQVSSDISQLPLNQTMNRQTVVTTRVPVPISSQLNVSPLPANLSQASAVPDGGYTASGQNPRPYQTRHGSSLTLDFLPEGDNMVPEINTESDFIDSLLKSGSSNDDWMKDINLDEILGNHA
ncbi:mastermind-like protein 2 isoform X2 [Scleropages formosus]|uniref:mastermind-like protein 2 isoform X2 n=1 Tax=Scleropages formosus TaxID=113540 RepID=UPI0010FAB64F|nr:mastermind-like protein 2 isoform X2 [Scleropages formosus]